MGKLFKSVAACAIAMSMCSCNQKRDRRVACEIDQYEASVWGEPKKLNTFFKRLLSDANRTQRLEETINENGALLTISPLYKYADLTMIKSNAEKMGLKASWRKSGSLFPCIG